jgi:MFS family permease
MMSNVAVVTVIPHLKDIFANQPNIELYARLMITIPSLFIALLAPFLGHIINRFGKYPSAIFGLVLFGLSGSAGYYLASIEAILFSRAILGVSIAILMIVSTSLVGDYFHQSERHKFMGLQTAFTSFGGIIFVVGGGILSDIFWRYPFLIYLIGFVLLPLVMLYLVPKHTLVAVSDELAPKGRLVGIYALAFVLMLVFYILPTQMPFLMMNHFEASGTLTGAIISCAFVFHAVGSITFARLKNKMEFSSIYILGMSVIAIGFMIIGIVDNVYLFFITAPMMGFGGGMLMTNVTAWMLSLAHHSKRVKSSGYLTSAFFLGQFFSPLLSMPIIAIFGIQEFFSVFGGLIFIWLGIVVGYRRLVKTSR